MLTPVKMPSAKVSSRSARLGTPLARGGRTAFALTALGFGVSIVVLAALVQLAGYLPPVVQGSQVHGALVRGYDILEPLMIDHSSPRYLGLLGVGVGICVGVAVGSGVKVLQPAMSKIPTSSKSRLAPFILSAPRTPE